MRKDSGEGYGDDMIKGQGVLCTGQRPPHARTLAEQSLLLQLNRWLRHQWAYSVTIREWRVGWRVFFLFSEGSYSSIVWGHA